VNLDECRKGNVVHESTKILTFFDKMKPLKTDNGCKMKFYYTFIKIFSFFRSASCDFGCKNSKQCKYEQKTGHHKMQKFYADFEFVEKNVKMFT
jgi:hypothetical protein